MTASVVRLSARERQVLDGLAAGWSQVELADRLGLEVSGVKSHAGRLYRKLGVGGRVHAVAVAWELGLLS